MDELILRSLTFDPFSEDEALCRHLERIRLEQCIDAEDGLFSTMVQSRWSTKLKFVGVVFAYLTHEKDKACLAHMMDSGLDVDIQSGETRSQAEALVPDWK